MNCSNAQMPVCVASRYFNTNHRSLGLFLRPWWLQPSLFVLLLILMRTYAFLVLACA